MTIFKFIEALNEKARKSYAAGSRPRYQAIIDGGHHNGEPRSYDLRRDEERIAGIRTTVEGTVVAVVVGPNAPVQSLRLIESVVPEGVTVR